MSDTDLKELIEIAARRLGEAKRVLVLSGAGISAESGIPTFRDAQTGLWQQYNPVELASPDGFRANPRLVWDWYEYRRDIVRNSHPNPGHFALAELEQHYPDQDFLIVTQNVDQFHQQAGSVNVVELHGRIMENRCFEEGRVISDTELDKSSVPPRCPCGAYARPGVVWFGEPIPEEAFAFGYVAACESDVCLVVGTSGMVQPAAGLPAQARYAGAFLIEVNNQESALTEICHIHLNGKSGEILPLLVKELKT